MSSNYSLKAGDMLEGSFASLQPDDNPNGNAPIEVLAYTRVSTKRQAKEGVSLAYQEEAIGEYSKRCNMKIVASYRDDGYSAKNANRPALKRMLEDIIKKKYPNVKHVVVYNTSRMSRDTQSYNADIATVLKSHGITLRSTQENIDETPMGRAMLGTSIVFQQLENDQRAATVKNNMHFAGSDGWWQSRPPIGMVICRYNTGEKKSNGKKRTHAYLVPDNAYNMADKVRAVLIRFSKGDMTMADLMRYAEKTGVRTVNGNPLNADGIKRLLLQPAYAGLMQSAVTEGRLIKAQWDGLISPEIFLDNVQRVCALRRGNASKSPKYKRNNPDYPLKGTLICSHCEAYLRGSAPTGGSGKKSPRYHCSECKSGGSIGVDEAHAAFKELLKNVAPNKNTRELFRVIAKRTLKSTLGEANKAIKRCRKELSENDKAYEDALLKAAKGGFSDERLEKLETVIHTRRNELNAEIEKLERQQAISEKAIDRLISFMGEPARLWGKADLPTRQLLQQLVFPNGVKCSPKEKIFGTDNISPLYSVISTKKEPSGSDLSSMVHLVQSNWNIIYNELLRWETLLEKSSLIKHIPYALRTSYS